jgi:NADPH-dependent 2,4-dienoyl-CoA reductase/sulfur reductase-like enzyme
MKFLIIGGDAAGMSAASQAKRLAPESEVVVLEMTQDVSYGACGLPYKIPDGHEMEELQVITAQRFREERGIDVRLGHRVERLLPAEKKVRGVSADGAFEESYDKLLVATGARVRRPPIPGLDQLWHDGAYPLKTLQDGRVLKQAVQGEVERAVVIGAGYIGLEATEGLHDKGIQVTVVEALPELLPFLPEGMQKRVMQEAEKHQVPIHLETLVQGLERDDAGTIRVRTNKLGELQADLVLVSTGVQPNAELAADAGLALGDAGSVAVDEVLQTSDPDILSAGDCADARHAITGKSVWIPLALRANRAGKLAGGNALGQRKPAPPVMGTAVFKFFGLQIARTGLSQSEAADAGLDAVSAGILASTRAHYIPGGGKLSVWLQAEKGSGKLLGGAMVGPEGAAHKIDTVVAALHAGLTAADLYDMDLAYAPPFGPSWSPLLIAASKLNQQI